MLYLVKIQASLFGAIYRFAVGGSQATIYNKKITLKKALRRIRSKKTFKSLSLTTETSALLAAATS